MFFKYASNLLQNIANECLLKSFACKDDEVADLYRNISNRLNGLVLRMGVEHVSGAVNTEDD
jgi:hypothetical protein